MRNRRWGEQNGSGLCFLLGAGYHLFAGKSFSVTSAVGCRAGHLEEETCNAITVSIGFSWD